MLNYPEMRLFSLSCSDPHVEFVFVQISIQHDNGHQMTFVYKTPGLLTLQFAKEINQTQ